MTPRKRGGAGCIAQLLTGVWAWVLASGSFSSTGGAPASGASEPATSGGPPVTRRLSEQQFRTSVADIFGADIKVAGRFEPEIRADGLLALGEAKVTTSPSAFEQIEKMAHSIATQIFDEQHRQVLGCAPGDAKAADDACAGKVIERFGFRLYRRPLLADGYPDPQTGQCTALSVANRLKAAPAFIIDASQVADSSRSQQASTANPAGN